MTTWHPSGPGTRPLVCAHRGASAHAPENTIEAAHAALAAGAAWIEFDVRPHADGLVVHHDPVTAGGAHVASLSTGALDDVPTFAAFVDACGPLGLDIELKTDDIGMPIERFVEVVAAEIERHVLPRDAGSVLVTSFDQPALDAFSRLRPDVATGVLFHDRSGEWAIERAVEHGHDAIVPWYPLVTAELVAAAREHQLRVLTWTVNDAADARAVAAAGVDMVIGDDPAALIDTLHGS